MPELRRVYKVFLFERCNWRFDHVNAVWGHILSLSIARIGVLAGAFSNSFKSKKCPFIPVFCLSFL